MVLAEGLIFLILAFPGGDKEKSQESQWLSGRNGTRTADDAGGGEPGNSFYRDSLTESGGQGKAALAATTGRKPPVYRRRPGRPSPMSRSWKLGLRSC